MHKLSFYPRLAAGNLWRNKSTYLPYILASVVAIFTFYTLLAINSNGALDGIRGEAVVKSFTMIGTVILGAFCCLLIFYTNSFLIKRRKKEIGLYSILGMEKGNIGAVMLFETLFVAAISLILGILLGTILSKLIFWALLRLIHFPVAMDMPVSFSSIAITAAYFGAIFLLTLLGNLRQVHIANPIELMAGAKQGEKEPKASWLMTLLGILCLGGGYYVAVAFESPIESLMLFLVAVALVIIGTYCLFTSASIAILKLMRRNKRFYYHPDHFISVSGMIYRMKQNASGLAAICILSCMVLVTLSSTVALNVGMEDAMSFQYPYEYALLLDDADDGSALLEGIEQSAQKTGAVIENLSDYRQTSFAARGQNGFVTPTNDYSNTADMININLYLLEDYNKNQNEQRSLAPGEALLLTTGTKDRWDSLTLNGVKFAITHLDQLGKTTAGASEILGRTLHLVVADQNTANAIFADFPSPGYSAQRTISFDLSGSEEAQSLFYTELNTYMDSLRTNAHFRMSMREDGRQDWYASNGGFLFLGIYFGILFMLAAALIIYYKQMSEGYDDAERFHILQKVGMSEAEVKKTINRQILTVFFLPLAVAVIHVLVAFIPIGRVSILNTSVLWLSGAVIIALYALIYFLVFRQTARTYFAIVRRKAA